MHDLASTRHAQVHDDPALAAAQGVEGLALARRELSQPAPALAPRRLQLDHLSAKVRKRRSRIRPSNDLSEFQHVNPVKRSRHARLPPVGRGQGSAVGGGTVSKVTHAVLGRIAALRAERAGGQAATPRWKRYAAATVPLLLVAALATTILLTSATGPQPTSAAQQSSDDALGDASAPSAQPCENGTVVPQPADNPGLVADCAVLLAAKDTLRGTATLNWSATTPITDWTGITVSRAPKRVTNLNLDSMSLNGSIPAELSGLSALRELRLAWNRLTGTIPPELGQLTQLGQLVLGGNRLTGAIPPELGSIGATLTTLQLSGPNPLPTGIGLSGSIPPQLGNLTGLQQLWLNGNRLTGTIPTRLGRLTQLRGLHLDKNQLSGSIPTQLGALSNLTALQLQDNQLTGPLPSQLGGLTQLTKIYLLRNAGFSGCVPLPLRRVRYHHFDWLGLPDCAADAPDTPLTPLPTYTLTVTAGEGGSVDPAGATTHDEDSEVTLTASWNDATHTFAGWGGDCSGTATTCVLEMYPDKTVTASFTALPPDRCATTTDASCIRAVYKGAPGDYAQVQDIPADLLIQPNTDGHYVVERGQQITVVTAAQLPTGYTRFYLQRTPLERPSPTSYERLIPPVGTTYTFTPTPFEGAASELTIDLRSAKPWPLPRPGQKPQLGAVAVSSTFVITDPPSFREVRDLPPTDAGNPLEPGTYRMAGAASWPSLIIRVPTNPYGIKWFGTMVGGPYVAHCFADDEESANICIAVGDATNLGMVILRASSIADPPVTLAQVFEYMAASARSETSSP